MSPVSVTHCDGTGEWKLLLPQCPSELAPTLPTIYITYRWTLKLEQEEAFKVY